FESVVHEIVEATSGWWKLKGPVARDDIHRVLIGIVRAYRPHARLMAAAFDAATHDPMLRPMIDGFVDGSAAELRRHIRAGQQQGWIEPGVDPATMSVQLTWLAERTMNRMLPGAPDAAVRRIEDSYTDIVFRTLYATGGS
ncbi:MAG: TetR/AcrR family transcriptional regulator, ethionamide resistance regulator, partial [Thermoleophilaceae bacterium]|nr:TetR/AcrR family transcriptional regulator, ethionamide resistance regulator [Thermoleophilaceae bacterium]